MWAARKETASDCPLFKMTLNWAVKLEAHSPDFLCLYVEILHYILTPSAASLSLSAAVKPSSQSQIWGWIRSLSLSGEVEVGPLALSKENRRHIRPQDAWTMSDATRDRKQMKPPRLQVVHTDRVGQHIYTSPGSNIGSVSVSYIILAMVSHFSEYQFPCL